MLKELLITALVFYLVLKIVQRIFSADFDSIMSGAQSQRLGIGDAGSASTIAGSSSQTTDPTSTGLRNSINFPPFKDVPHENEIGPPYYKFNNKGVVTLAKHWCYLGEIVHIDRIFRLRLETRDINGEKIPVAFHPQNQRSPGITFRALNTLDTNSYQETMEGGIRFGVGHTFAYLHPEQHDFMDMTCGFRIESTARDGHFKVIPYSIDEIYRANDRIIAQKSKPTCEQCGKETTNTVSCPQCKAVHYCGKDCQASAAKKKEHQKECKLLSEVQWFLRQNWDPSGDRLKPLTFK